MSICLERSCLSYKVSYYVDCVFAWNSFYGNACGLMARTVFNAFVIEASTREIGSGRIGPRECCCFAPYACTRRSIKSIDEITTRCHTSTRSYVNIEQRLNGLRRSAAEEKKIYRGKNDRGFLRTRASTGALRCTSVICVCIERDLAEVNKISEH